MQPLGGHIDDQQPPLPRIPVTLGQNKRVAVDLFDRFVRTSKRLGPLPECPCRVVADSVRLDGQGARKRLPEPKCIFAVSSRALLRVFFWRRCLASALNRSRRSFNSTRIDVVRMDSGWLYATGICRSGKKLAELGPAKFGIHGFRHRDGGRFSSATHCFRRCTERNIDRRFY